VPTVKKDPLGHKGFKRKKKVRQSANKERAMSWGGRKTDKRGKEASRQRTSTKGKRAKKGNQKRHTHLRRGETKISLTKKQNGIKIGSHRVLKRS